MRWVAKVVDKFTPRKTAATWRSVNVGELSEGDLGKVTGPLWNGGVEPPLAWFVVGPRVAWNCPGDFVSNPPGRDGVARPRSINLLRGLYKLRGSRVCRRKRRCMKGTVPLSDGWRLRVTTLDESGQPAIFRYYLVFEADKDRALALVRMDVSVNTGKTVEALAPVSRQELLGQRMRPGDVKQLI
jgi:hypothetical protein